MSARDFALALDKAKLETDEKINLAIQKMAIDALTVIVQRSPVKSGRFRNNWITTVSAPSSQTLKGTDKSGQRSINSGTSRITTFDYKKHPAIFIQNNLPYANRLENGWSRQAPQGMVALTMRYLRRRYREILI